MVAGLAGTVLEAIAVAESDAVADIVPLNGRAEEGADSAEKAEGVSAAEETDDKAEADDGAIRSALPKTPWVDKPLRPMPPIPMPTMPPIPKPMPKPKFIPISIKPVSIPSRPRLDEAEEAEEAEAEAPTPLRPPWLDEVGIDMPVASSRLLERKDMPANADTREACDAC